MLTLFTFLLLIILISRLVEKSIKVPSTLIVILLSFFVTYMVPDLFTVSKEEFNEILYLMLPVILLPDILNLSIDDLKKHSKEIFYLAVVAVVLSITIAVSITPFILPEYQFTIGMLIALFAMLMATDAITVTSIMSKFKLPERLKIYAEYESLFNDVTALIIFYFVALPLINGGELSFVSLNITLFKVLILSTVIGVVTAYIGYLSIKILKNPFDQFIIIYLVVIVSFLLAEHFHIAGILSIVASVLTFKYFVQKDIETKQSPVDINENLYESVVNLIKKVPALTKREFRGYKKEAMFIGIFANAIVFIIVANIINYELLVKYYKEILVVFALTSIIRMSAMYSMIKFLNLPFRWARALTYAGAKGALALIMVHSLPKDFIYIELFEAVVIGNVLLTTFIYTFILMFHIYHNKEKYQEDSLKQSPKQKENEEGTKELISLLEKDSFTSAYNKTFIDDILQKEISRSIRYKTELSAIEFEITNIDSLGDNKAFVLERLGKIVNSQIRINDYFGKISENRYILLLTNTSISGAMILAEKMSYSLESIDYIGKTSQVFFGLTEATDTDDVEQIYDKLNDALKRAIKETGEKIEIEF